MRTGGNGPSGQAGMTGPYERTGAAVGRVVVLPLSKAVRMAWQSLRLRPTRTALTILSIMAAVAFVLFVLAVSHIEAAAKDATRVTIGRAETPAQQGEGGGRLLWIAAISVCTCTVGIVNAMLMSITERYREIGTLKCLGALDSFILKLFLLESVFQGLVGSAAGVVVGLAMAMVAGLVSYGGAAFTAAPWGRVGLDALIAVGIGMFLSVVGALYPAHVAAKMAPVDAMRARI